ncbi:MAG TPA: M1 family metallopeptidase [Thermoanaerobaculia bacterium]|nr:M1 family metallopeptidase [Thermoanaerobaculia bacterium]
MRRLTLSLLVLLAVSPLSAATRLPVNVIPDHYTIRIAPDLQAETFSGEETIDVDVKEPVDSITLHSVDLVLKDVTVETGGKQLPATVTADAPNETVTLKVAQTIAPGRAAIHAAFDGKLLPQLRGLYLSRTAKRKYAATQFEAMSARRAFPCFDEPAMKATFDITMIVDRGDTAISNGPIVSDTPAGEGKHALRFGTTKKISTYLVAMLVGDFQCIDGAEEGVPIRVCSTPGLQQLGHFALGAAQASIRFFNRYYGIPYPFQKLDLIGIPDFAAGAMENAGAITFRETDLLIDDKTASALVQKRVAEVVAHEIAHQWFGDLVTMKWWNDIWLNEGFATFMSAKPIEAWKPEWRGDLDKPVQTDTALNVDSQLSTRPIRGPATAEGGGGFFDATITYDKTSSVLRMVEEWIGPDAFRDAIRAYLKKYAWSNAAAEDFWASMKGSSQQPIDVVLQSFTDLTGAPLLHVVESCDANQRSITLMQERMLPRGAAVSTGSWTIPVCISGRVKCELMTKPSETFTPPIECERPLLFSRNGAGYFVLDYPSSERVDVRNHLREFAPSERIWFHGNEWLLTRNNRLDISQYLALLKAMPRPAERQTIAAITDNLVFLDQRLVNARNRAAWQAFVHDVLRGDAPFTWEAPAGETSEQRISRAAVLWTLGYAGDAQIIAGARRVAAQYMKDPAAVDALIADRALRLSAVHGDEAFFNQVLDQLAGAQSPEVAARYRNLLPLFRDPKVNARAIEFIYSDRIRNQDLPVVATAMFPDPVTRPAAWAAAKARWSDIQQRSTATGGRIAASTASFCDPESKKDVEAFFAEHPPRGGQRGLSRALESIDTCIAFRATQQGSFDEAMK